MEKKTRIYFAAPLFTQAEWRWNKHLADELSTLNLEVILPQNRAEPMLSGKEEFNAHSLFVENITAIEQSDIILAIFDQADPDSGTCWECGYAYKLGHPIIGLRTDLRRLGDDPNASVNLMLSQSCAEFVELPFDKREDVLWIARQVDEAVKRLISTSKDTDTI
jgi:nucleoside 2-deoxyribosyltransferase